MLKVNCGVSGRVRIVKTNSETGEVVKDIKFDNVWTDTGLSRLSTGHPYHLPGSLNVGTGVADTPHNEVVALKNKIGRDYQMNFSGKRSAKELQILEDVCVLQVTRSTTIPKMNVEWQLSELGLRSYHRYYPELLTYTLVKNEQGQVEPLTVSPIEILTVYYTIQISYPMSMPPQLMEVEGLPETTAEFVLQPDWTTFATGSIGKSGAYIRAGGPDPFTGLNYTGNVANGYFVIPLDVANDAPITHFTFFDGGMSNTIVHRIWNIDPPITKNNTQELHVREEWVFENVPIVEIPEE